MMFKIDKKEISKYLTNLIKEKFPSARQFCIAYFELQYGKDDFDDRDSAIQNLQNRICQIEKGNKGIQIEDLPVFSDLLGVSIENILSAGTVCTPVSNRITNYSIAFSKNPDEWKNYIKRDDKLILNPDEYNKTVIDYALDAGNYPFLKYLMDNGYIWFVGSNNREYGWSFGAGTNIKRREIGHVDTLDILLNEKEQEGLRFKVITLAIRNKDFAILDTLHAREFPLLYRITHFGNADCNEPLPRNINIDTFVKSITKCPYTVQSYFFEDFTIQSSLHNATNTFIFPYAGVVLDIMIAQKNKNVSRFLEKTIEHNKSVLKKLSTCINESTEVYKDYYDNFYKDTRFPVPHNENIVWDYYSFYPETGFVSFRNVIFDKNSPVRGFITNVIQVSKTSPDPEIQILIDELNETYNTFIEYQKRNGGQKHA